MARMPVYYIPHGAGPCFFMDWTPQNTWHSLKTWLAGIPLALPERPAALLVFSAHWEEPVFTLAVNARPELYCDYYGFPEHTYELVWPAPTAPGLFPRVRSLLSDAGIAFLQNQERDFDHGVFIPGLLSFPAGDVPCMQISLRGDFDPAAHIALGKALAPLRDEGVLCIGSGMSYHNMRAFRLRDNNPIPGADVFDAWLTETLTAVPRKEREHRLVHWENAPNARAAHPHEDHLLPLMVAAGMAEAAPGRLVFHDRAMGAPLSAYVFD